MSGRLGRPVRGARRVPAAGCAGSRAAPAAVSRRPRSGYAWDRLLRAGGAVSRGRAGRARPAGAAAAPRGAVPGRDRPDAEGRGRVVRFDRAPAAAAAARRPPGRPPGAGRPGCRAAATTTRPTWPASSATWPAARRARWLAEEFRIVQAAARRPPGRIGAMTRRHHRRRLADAPRPRRPRADQVPGRGVRLRGDRRLRRRRPGPPRRAVLAPGGGVMLGSAPDPADDRGRCGQARSARTWSPTTRTSCSTGRRRRRDRRRGAARHGLRLARLHRHATPRATAGRSAPTAGTARG